MIIYISDNVKNGEHAVFLYLTYHYQTFCVILFYMIWFSLKIIRSQTEFGGGQWNLS